MMIIGFDTARAENVQEKGVPSDEFHLEFV